MVLINFGEREEKIDMNIWLNNLPDELELAAVGTDSCYVHGYVMSFMHIVCIQSNFDRYCHYCYYHFVRTFSHFGRSKWKWSTQMYNGAQLIDTIKMHTKIWPIYLRRMEQSIICELLYIPFNFTMAVSVSFLLWNYIHVSIFFFFFLLLVSSISSCSFSFSMWSNRYVIYCCQSCSWGESRTSNVKSISKTNFQTIFWK